MLAVQAIRAGDATLAVAGGMESMSRAPYLLARVREGLRMGHGEALDSMVHDGLWCAFEHWHMGQAGEVVAAEYQVTRDAQDRYALASHQKAAPRRARAASPPRSCRCTVPRKGQAPLVVGLPTNRCVPTRRSRRCRAQAGVQERRHRDGGQRAAGQRRRGRAGARVGRGVGAGAACGRASWRRRPAGWRRSTCS
jgi:hypothetical protein